MTEAQRQADALAWWAKEHADDQEIYGMNWGDPQASEWLAPVMDEWLLPALRESQSVIEIGSGGGRWSRYLLESGAKCLLVDGTPASETLIRSRFPGVAFDFGVCENGDLQIEPASVDYVFSFDTFVHFDLRLTLAYIDSIGKALQPGGVLHLHYGDMLNATWMQSPETPETLFFRYVGREEMEKLLQRVGLTLTGRAIDFYAAGSRLVEAVKQ